MQLIKVVKKTNTKIEQAKTMLSIFCLLSDIKLSQAELTVLAYFLVYKITDDTKDLIIKSQILKSEDSLKNTMSRLNKFGLIKKSINKEWLLSEKIYVHPDSMIGMLIKIDNT